MKFTPSQVIEMALEAGIACDVAHDLTRLCTLAADRALEPQAARIASLEAERDQLRAEVERMHEAIAAFCDLNSWGADAWKNQPHIKALFDIDTARKAAP